MNINFQEEKSQPQIELETKELINESQSQEEAQKEPFKAEINPSSTEMNINFQEEEIKPYSDS